MKKVAIFVILVLIFGTIQVAMGQIAITEFLNDPLGSDTDMGSEYIELYNFSENDVDIQNWMLKDEDHDSLGGEDYFIITDVSFIIPPGGYAVLASNKDTLAFHWFGGVADVRVLEYGGPSAATMQLSNSGDELILLDTAGDTVWNFAWSNDDAYDGTTDDGYSTYLDYGTDFSATVTSWGNKAVPGIVRNGNDIVAGSPLGYEGGAFTADLASWLSTAGNSGSPLTGNYQEKLALRSDYKIAITEFINDPLGSDTDMGSEFIELFNYGTTNVDIQDWTMKDEDHDSLGGPDYFTITDSSFIIPPGGYAVLTANKDTLAAHWLGGESDARVLEYGGPNSTTMQLSNSGDELILLDAAGDTVWNFAWSNDDAYDGTKDDGYSTYLDYGTDFLTTVTIWGNKAAPGIVRNGNDNVAGSPLGYEGGAFTVDVSAWVSTAGNSGSPLAGNYLAPTGRSAEKIAITEFVNDPLGSDTDMGSEYIELFNYGTTNVDIQNWTMKDEDHDLLGGPDYFTITDASFIIPPGGYAVLTASKDTLAAHWFGGVADVRVLEYGGPNSTTMQLSNSGDELILFDAAGDSVWNFAWSNDDAYDGTTDDGFSTYLDYGTDFSTTVTSWGNKAAPGIVRNGNDNVFSAPLGYEGGAFTADVSAWMSTAGNSGSPLTGNYLPIATNIDDENRLLPTGYLLKQNYPNPFNPVTNIHYQLPEQAHVSLIIYDLLGKKVATLVNEQQAAGSYSIPWHAVTDTKTMLSTGVYLCRINAQGSNNGFSKVVKMLYLK